MKIYNSIHQILNAVKNTNGIKLHIWYGVTTFTYFVNKILRLLNY